MKKLRKLLILDDDPHYGDMLALKLRRHFPELMISFSTHDHPMANYDIYILDNDFGGTQRGAFLAEQIRQTSPQSLVVMLSGTLQIDVLKRLVNCHAAGVFDKADASATYKLFDLVERYLITSARKSEPVKPKSVNPVKAVHGLLNAWNERLAYEERQ